MEYNNYFSVNKVWGMNCSGLFVDPLDQDEENRPQGAVQNMGAGHGPVSSKTAAQSAPSVALGVDGAVGRDDGFVEGAVGQAEPGRAFVVQIRQSELLELGDFGARGVDRALADQSPGLLAADPSNIREVIRRVDQIGDGLHPLGRVEPSLALLVERRR